MACHYNKPEPSFNFIWAIVLIFAAWHAYHAVKETAQLRADLVEAGVIAAEDAQ